MRTTSISTTVEEPQAPVIVPVISMEEEHVLLDQAMESAMSIESSMRQILTLEDVADGLEDLAVTAGNIKEATPTETALLENAGDMAAAGSSMSGDEIIPSMESYIGKPIAMEAVENIKAMAKQIWESIKRFLESVWKKIDHFWQSLVQVFQRKQATIEELKKRFDAVGEKPTSDEPLNLDMGGNILSVDYKPIKSERELTSASSDFAITVSVMERYWDSVGKRGDLISAAISHFAPIFTESVTNNLASVFKTHPLQFESIGTNRSAHKPEPGFVFTEGRQLLGNVVLLYKRPDADNTDTLAWLERESRSGISLVPSRPNASSENNKHIVIPVLSKAAISDLIGHMKMIIDTLAKYNNGISEHLQGKSEMIAKASERAEASLTNMDENRVTTSENVDFQETTLLQYRTLLRFNHAYAEWVRNPSIALLRQAFSVVNILQLLIVKSLEKYPAIDAEQQAAIAQKRAAIKQPQPA